MCRRSDHRYGALVIFEVNEEKTEQIVWCTPKLHYPFNKNGEFIWPPINELTSFVKLDGTNILAYSYQYKGKEFVSFKTRLGPVLSDMAFGLFKSMWEEYTEDNSWVKEVIDANPNFNLSFELYGARNPITIEYSIPLEVSLLFGVRKNDGAVRTPLELNILDNTKVPTYHILGKEQPTDHYQYFREQMSDINAKKLLQEGMVFYVHDGGPSRIMFKCKPEEIEKIHWAASGYIPKNAIWTTLINAFETEENPTKEYIRELLLEEFTDQQINKSIPRIRKLYFEVKSHMEITKSINELYFKAREEGFDVAKDKAATFRFLSQFFKKDQMKKVASIVLKQAGLLTQ